MQLSDLFEDHTCNLWATDTRISSILTDDCRSPTSVESPCSCFGGFFDLALGAPLDFALAFEVVVGVEVDVELELFVDHVVVVDIELVDC